MILVTGITGKVGTELLPQIASSKEKFRLLARDPSKVKAPANCEVVRGDLADAASVDAALKGVKRMFLVIASFPGSAELHNKTIDAAKRAGVSHIVRLSVAGADASSKVTLARWHAESDAHLEKSGVPFTILQPGSFMQNFFGSAASIKKEGVFYGAAQTGPNAFIDAKDIAAVALHALTTSGHEGKRYVLSGPEALTNAQAAEKLTRALGKPVKYVDLAPEQFKGGLLSAGLPAWLAEDYVTMAQATAAGYMGQVSPNVAALLGKGRTFDEFLAANAAAFKA